MQAYRHDHIVTLDETNMVGNVYFAHYLHWQGHCRERFLADHAPDVLRDLMDGTLVMVTASCSMEYFAELFALQPVTVSMYLKSSTASRLTMDYDFHSEGRLTARGSQTVACMARRDGTVEPVVVPPALVRALEQFR